MNTILINTPKFAHGDAVVSNTDYSHDQKTPKRVMGVRANYEYLIEYKDGTRGWEREKELMFPVPPKTKRRK